MMADYSVSVNKTKLQITLDVSQVTESAEKPSFLPVTSDL